MSTENTLRNKVVIDTKDVASKLSFLIGKTIAFRDGLSDATTTTQVVAVKAENTPGTEGHPQVSIYTYVGIENIRSSHQFNDIMVLDSTGVLIPLGSYADNMGISF